MKMFPLKWEPRTHVLLRPTQVDFRGVPGVAREQARKLVRQLGDDARWIVQPLVHAATHRQFDGARCYQLAEKSVEPPEGFSPQGWVDALCMLSRKYPDIPAVLWDTLAVMGLRPNADQEEAIPNLGDMLLHPWSLADAALHAAAKATALWSDLCRVLERHSGRYPEHGCGCTHILRALPGGASLPPMPGDRFPHATREWWDHFLAEIALIHVLGFPFALHGKVETYEGTLIPA